jgi:dUTP pyrophosphatase
MNDVINVKLEYTKNIPTYQTPGSAGADVCSTEYCILRPGERHLISTGIYLELPEGHECQVRPRSGLAVRDGLTVLNAPGTIDSDFRGEVKVLLINLGMNPVTICEGDRIAQLVFAPVSRATFEIVESLSETLRSVGGFGSTGKR